MRRAGRPAAGRRALAAIAAALVAVGAALVALPFANDALYRTHAASQLAVFEDAAAGPAAGIRAAELHALLQERNEELLASGQAELDSTDSYETDDLDLTLYGLPEPDVIGYLEIPRLGQTLPIVLGASQANMNRGACHLTETSYPIGGPGTNCVTAAHRAMISGVEMFRDIEEIRIGDELSIRNFEGTLVYRACDIEVVRP